MPTPLERTMTDLDNIETSAANELGGMNEATLVRDAAHLYREAGEKYAAELEDVEQNWNRLEVGAAESRRDAAKRELADQMRLADKFAAAGHHALAERFEAAMTPKAPSGTDETRLLRDELAMIVAGAKNGSEVATMLTKVAQGSRRDLAAIALSPWGKSLLESRGHPRPSEAQASIRAGAIAVASEHGSEKEKQAAAQWARSRRAAVGLVGAARVKANAAAGRAERQQRNRTGAADRKADAKLDREDRAAGRR